jgi:hypothetical protein
MIRRTVSAAVLLGIVVFALGQILYFVYLRIPGPQSFLHGSLLLTPGIASLCSTAFASEKKIAVGFSMVVFGSVIQMLAWYVYQLLGIPLDRIGGIMATFAIVFAYHVVACTIGTVIGYSISIRSRRLSG